MNPSLSLSRKQKAPRNGEARFLRERDCAQLLDVAAELCEVTRLSSLPPLLLSALLKLIPAEFAGCHIASPGRRRIAPYYAPERPAYPAYNDQFWPLVQSHPLSIGLLRQGATAWRISDVASTNVFRRTPCYNALYRPLSIDHELVTMVPLDHEPDSFLIVGLHRKKTDFTDGEKAILNLLLPHISNAQRRCASQSGPAARSESAGAPPTREQFIQLIRNRPAWRLNPREIDVLFWLAQGKTNAEIGLLLDISPRTAETHALHAYRKMGVENRYSAIVETLTLQASADKRIG